MAAQPPESWGARTHEPTAGQTVGPFFSFGTRFDKMNQIVFPHSPQAIVLAGRVLQGDGAPIPDSMIEIWQLDSDGAVPRSRGTLHRDDHTFTGFGRAFTTDEGRWHFWTRNPGSDAPGKPPFFAAIVYARGLPNKLHTRIYLPEDQSRLDADPFLSSLSPDERATLIAKRLPDGGLRHDIRLQGENQTVFISF
ncbi:MAG: protocatechuate 3,4-dioxygenase subunit alpha [Microbacterium sp.]|uniref:protocatechuate 3,4-dioxygenase subunit alpha n=1 Tax=Microbacterium sp. TaxID=51671 RepID=UPI0039E36B68